MTGIPTLAPMQWVEATVAEHYGSGSDLDILTAVNHRANTKIIANPGYPPISQAWQVWPERGWCGDFALTKRSELLKMGWPTSRLRIAEVVTASGEEHAVLVVSLTGTDIVLDNRNEALRQPNRTGYKWVKIQSKEDPNLWQEGGL